MPFLTIITRHKAERAELFEVCKASIEAQTDRDWQHLVIEDEVGRGVPWANKQFEAHAGEVEGDYVFILDDDDKLVEPRFVALMRNVAWSEPALIVVKMDHTRRIGGLRYVGDGEYVTGLPAHDLTSREIMRLKWKQNWSRERILTTGLYEDESQIVPFVLPPVRHWGKDCPPFAYIGISAVVVRRDVWLDAVLHFAARRGGDYPFIERCFELAGGDIVWIDQVMSQCQRPPFGRPR